MKRVRFDEKDFETLLRDGTITIEGVKFDLPTMIKSGNFNRMIHGEVVRETNVTYILADIGYDHIYGLIRKYT